MKNGFIEWPNKASHLNEFKRPKLVFGCSFLEQITFLEEERGERGEENYGLQEIKLWCDPFPLFASKRPSNMEGKI